MDAAEIIAGCQYFGGLSEPNLTGYDPADRFFHFLREHYGQKNTYHISITKRDIAGEIGVTPESFSRLLRRLSDEGTIEWKGDTLRRRDV